MRCRYVAVLSALAHRPERGIVTGFAIPLSGVRRRSKTLAPRILLSSTLRWPIAARLAIAFGKRGCDVAAICPRQHPVRAVGTLREAYPYPLFAPIPGMARAIESFSPDLVVPCDDRAALHLQQLHALAGAGKFPAAMQKLAAQSLGSPEACVLAMSRGKLMELAQTEGVRTPATTRVSSAAELGRWLEQHDLPAVLKQDGTWGGQGTAVVRSMGEALDSFERLASPRRVSTSLRRLFLDRDPFPVLDALRADPPVITVQQYIQGVPANRAVACWQGKVLAGISVEAIHTQHATGPATVVRMIDHPEMSTAVARLVSRLGISGLWGADFMLSNSTGAAFLIEVNPRATPVCHLPLGVGRDLPAALVARLQAGSIPLESPVNRELIALFPGELHRDRFSTHLRADYHDVPWEEPALVRDGMLRPWSERGLLARARSLLRRRRQAGRKVAPGPVVPHDDGLRGD